MSDDVRNQVFNHGSNLIKQAMVTDIPFDTVPLPSKGLAYPPSSPLHNKDSVDIRAMTAREEDILMSRALIKKGTVVTHLIKSCLADQSIPVEHMLSGDRYALLVALRVMSYGPEYEASVDCPSCGAKGNHSFNLAELPINNLSAAPVSPGMNLFEFELPISRKKIQFKFLTGRDEEEMLLVQTQKKAKLGHDLETSVTSRLAQTIVAVDGDTNRASIVKAINNMIVRDASALRKYMADSEPGVDMTQTISCSECDNAEEVSVPVGVGFFFPKQ
jgi:hypothetical protein